MGLVHLDDGDVATVRLDDGKLNALDLDAFRELDDALARCRAKRAVVLAGRDGVFTAGLNVKVLANLDDDGLHELLTTFGRTVMTLWLLPVPTVVAATGHAIAAGTMLAMAADHAVAAEGDFRWGLTETRIGFALPEFGIALARGNVRADRLDDLLLPGALIAPGAAVEAGFADELASPDEVLEVARTRAEELAELPPAAYAETKRRLRGATAEAVLARLDDDIRAMVALPRS